VSETIGLSIRVAFIATCINLILAIGIARLLSNSYFKGKGILESLFVLPMVLPPSVTGFILLRLLGRHGFIGIWLDQIWGVKMLFTWQATVIAAVVVSFPLMYQSCKAAFMSVDRSVENVARTLGANEWRVFWKVGLPLAFPTIVSGIVLTFARALGEFGATLMIGGNIAGETRTIPIAIFFANESGNNQMATTLTWIVVLYGFVTIYALNHWMKAQNKGAVNNND